MFAREDLFHMDRRAIDYTVFVNGEMADAFLDIVYQGFPYLIGAITLGITMYGIYAMFVLMDIPRAISLAWYLSRPVNSWLDLSLVLSSIMVGTAIVYLGYTMISDLDTCLEKAKNDRLELLAKIEALEKEKDSMRTIFKQMIDTLSEDEFKQLA